MLRERNWMPIFEACSRMRKLLVTIWVLPYNSLLSASHRCNKNKIAPSPGSLNFGVYLKIQKAQVFSKRVRVYWCIITYTLRQCRVFTMLQLVVWHCSLGDLHSWSNPIPGFRPRSLPGLPQRKQQDEQAPALPSWGLCHNERLLGSKTTEQANISSA